ncbi:MAG TPA: hypothetical protein PKY31_03935 [Spirochaetota bacterium]|nr:hypothetical protein [Spirochaetota bacterium]
MKKMLLLTAALLALTSFAPTDARAMVDAALFGGYTFRGDVEIVDTEFDGVRGYQYGIFAHLNVKSDLFMAGLGFAVQAARLEYDANGTDAEFEIENSWGPDFLVMLTISSTMRPYGRIGFSILDSLEYDYGLEYKDKTRFLNSGWWALGVGIQMAPQVILFGEFQRFVTHLNEEHRMVRYSANFGIMLAM